MNISCVDEKSELTKLRKDLEEGKEPHLGASPLGRGHRQKKKKATYSDEVCKRMVFLSHKLDVTFEKNLKKKDLRKRFYGLLHLMYAYWWHEICTSGCFAIKQHPVSSKYWPRRD